MGKKVFFKKRNSGQTTIVIALFFSMVSVTLLLILAEPSLKRLAQVSNFRQSNQSLIAAKAAAEEHLYRINNSLALPPVVTLSVNGVTASSTLVEIDGEKYLISRGESQGLFRSLQYHLEIGTRISFQFGLHSGIGGVGMRNQSSVLGNVYSNGIVVAENDNTIAGSVVSAGTSGSITGVISTESMYARTLTDSSAAKYAYYLENFGSSASGSLCPNPNCFQINEEQLQPNIPLPVTDEMVRSWEVAAQAGENIPCTGTYTIEEDRVIGPAKINCDLIIKGADVTLTGPLWVTGDINIQTSTNIISHELNEESVAIIADNADDLGNPINRITSSRIFLTQQGEFVGSGSGSYVLMLSMNSAAEVNGPSNTITAIEVSQGVSGALLIYAGHGLIEISQSTRLKEITAHQMNLSQSAQVIYDQGLTNLLFNSGEGQNYTVDWVKEIQ